MFSIAKRGLALVVAVSLPCAGLSSQNDGVTAPIDVKPGKTVPSTGNQEPIGPAPAPQQGKVKVQPPRATGPNAWFETTSVNLGTFLEGETGIAKFPFVNPRDVTHQIRNIQPNCQCAKARIVVGDREYLVENDPTPHTIKRVETIKGREEKQVVKHIAVGAGESGFVEMHLSLKGIKGPKKAFISMRTTDDQLRNIHVTAEARGVTFFKIVPPEINLNKMTWDEKREFSFEVSSDVKPTFEIVGVESTNESLVVTSQRQFVREGQSVWKIEGTYGPNTGNFGAGGVLKLKTDIVGTNDQPKIADVRVIAIVEGPMTVRPGTFLPFGRVKRKEGASKVVEFVPNGDFDLDFTDVHIEGLTVDEKWVKIDTSKEGRTLKLELTILPDAPRRLIRGDIKVGLNHPAEKEKSIQFNGFVR